MTAVECAFLERTENVCINCFKKTYIAIKGNLVQSLPAVTLKNGRPLFLTPLVNVKVERGSTFTYTSDLPYNVSIYARKIYVCTHGKITRQWKFTLSLINRSTLECRGVASRITLVRRFWSLKIILT